MKVNFGVPLTREQMKNVMGGVKEPPTTYYSCNCNSNGKSVDCV